MIKKCSLCGHILTKVNLVTSRNTFSVTKELNPNFFTKLEKVNAFICKHCGHVSFFVEDVNFLEE